MEQSEKNTIISLRDIFVRFDGEVILNHINLDFKDKEFITILGPSGCGKTTTLRIIGGFVEPESGDVLFDGKESMAHRQTKEMLIRSFKNIRFSHILMCLTMLLSV